MKQVTKFILKSIFNVGAVASFAMLGVVLAVGFGFNADWQVLVAAVIFAGAAPTI